MKTPVNKGASPECFGLTDVGRTREKNEDSFAILSDRNLFIVADGMGGHNAGEVASSEAVATADALFSAEMVERMRTEQAPIQPILQSALEEINRRIIQKSSENRAFSGMGCAFIVAFANDNILHTCHVGDVRCYVCRDSGIVQITSDHTQVAELVRAGRMSPEEAERSPLRSILTRAIGGTDDISPEYNSFALADGDRVLLCSDGLWGMVRDEKIHSIVRKKADLGAICQELIDTANAAGGKDNISVIMLEKNQGPRGSNNE
jgi:PPM family protein phosphatase